MLPPSHPPPHPSTSPTHHTVKCYSTHPHHTPITNLTCSVHANWSRSHTMSLGEPPVPSSPAYGWKTPKPEGRGQKRLMENATEACCARCACSIYALYAPQLRVCLNSFSYHQDACMHQAKPDRDKSLLKTNQDSAYVTLTVLGCEFTPKTAVAAAQLLAPT